MPAKRDISIPLSVPTKTKDEFVSNLSVINNHKDKIIMLAADQRVEHLNSSFYGKNISIDDLSPEHFFKIASISKVKLLATQFGHIDRYASEYPNINYIVKLNSISKFVKDSEGYTKSLSWIDLDYIKEFKLRTKTNIVGIGYTVFLGIKEESEMLKEAAGIVLKAHELGFPVIFWMYPKAFAYKNENDPTLINTACSIGCALGADIIKINTPIKKTIDSALLIKNAITSAGKTKVIISGGNTVTTNEFLDKAYSEVYKGGADGVAVGRNIHQKSLDEAVNFCNSLYDVVVNGSDPEFYKKSKLGVNSIL